MIFQIFWHNLVSKRVYTVVWSLVMLGFSFMIIIFYRELASSDDFRALANDLPDSIAALAGGETDFVSPAGYLNSKLVGLIFPIISLVLGLGLTSAFLYKDDETRTIELILASSVGRFSIINQKIMSMIAIISIIFFGAFLGIVMGKEIVSQFDMPSINILWAIVSMVLLGIVFGMLTMTLGCFNVGRAKSISISIAIFSIMYFIFAFSPIVSWLDSIRFLTLFSLVDSGEVLRNGVNYVNVFIMVAIVIIEWLLASYAFYKRDTP